MDLRGILDVGQHVPHGDPRVEPSFRLAGRVSQVVGGVLHLDDHREGIPSLLASEAYVDLRDDGFMRCLHAAFGAQTHEVAERLRIR